MSQLSNSKVTIKGRDGSLASCQGNQGKCRGMDTLGKVTQI